MSYVRNNPVKYIDPTGHRACITKVECADMGTTPNGNNQVSNPRPPAPKPPKPNPHDDDIPDDDGIVLPYTPGKCPLGQTCIINTPSPTYCGDGPNIFYNIFDCGGTFIQDLAFAIDIPFAGVEIILTAIGCVFGGKVGCAGGAKVGRVFFIVTGANNVETILGYISTGFTILADFSDGNLLGESTITALSTTIAGTFTTDPVADLIIDGYGAGYNHDIFNGVCSFFTEEPNIDCSF